MSIFNIAKLEKLVHDAISTMGVLASTMRRKFTNLDAEIDALQISKSEMLQDIERLKAQVKLIEHELAIVQRKSLAQKLREKGVAK